MSNNERLNNALDAAKAALERAQETLSLARSELEAAEYSESNTLIPDILSGLDAAVANVVSAQKAVNDLTSANGGRRKRSKTARKSRKTARKSRRRRTLRK